MRIDLTLAQINGLKLHFADDFEEDERGWLDALEGETDAFELVRRLLDKLEAEEGARDQLKEQIDNRKARMDRCAKRMDAQRDAIMAVMQCAGIDKLPLPEATLSLRKVAPKLVVTNEAALPDELCTFTRKPNLSAIRDAEVPPPGTALDNGGVSLTIRRK